MLEEMTTLIEVIECNSFTKAAANLHISQPTVSLHIKRLEKRFGVIALQRSKQQKKISVTQEGMILYQTGKELRRTVHNAEINLKELGAEINGSLRIGASLTIGEYFLPEFLGHFMNRYPHVIVEVVIDNTEHICRKLLSSEIDIALVEGEVVSTKFLQTVFYEDTLVVVAPNGWKNKLRKKELGEVNWVAREQGSGSRQQWEKFLIQCGVENKVKELIFNTNFAVKEAVKNKLGYALISEYIAEHAQSAGEVSIVEMDVSSKREFRCLTMQGHQQSKVVKMFFEHIKNKFGK